MTDSRRNVLQGIPPHPTTHAGLWLDKYLAAQGDNTSKKDLVQQVADQTRNPAPYGDFYKRWEAALKKAGARTRLATTRGRLAINLGAESVLETSIALHRTYGTPYIPGSALKGLAAAFARQHLGDEWSEKNEAYRELFGTTEQAGCVTFFDALYVPDSGYKHRALWPDVITVHHPDYYQGQAKPPADWDSPTPIPFLTATGKFLVALAGPDAWVDAAFQILGEALLQEGIGAKTSSGYGRMTLDGHTPSEPPESADAHTAATATPNAAVLTPSNDWPWRQGKMSRDRRYVADAGNPDQRYRVDRQQILPKGYTPAGKAVVDYAVIELADGTPSVWIKKRFYRIPE